MTKTMTADSEIPFERLVANVRKHAIGAVQAGLLHDLDMLEGECRKAKAQRDALARVIKRMEAMGNAQIEHAQKESTQILGADWKDPLKEVVDKIDVEGWEKVIRGGDWETIECVFEEFRTLETTIKGLVK